MTEQNGLERSSATERLRALLDERGVEWVAIGTDTCWTGADGYPMRAWETTNGTHMRVTDLTPEQAVEATLGSDLQAENEQLRELMRKVEHYEQYGCYECPHSSSCEVGTLYDEDCSMSLEIEREMRELGIEVDA